MANERYYYKTALGTDRGKKIQEFMEKGVKAATEADKLAKELGADERTDRPRSLYPGVGIGSLVFRRWPGGKRYRPIGNDEYIPNMKRKEGKEIAKRIMKLPGVDALDFCKAFGVPLNESKTPQWFVFHDAVYLSSSYQLGEGYSTISQKEFDAKRKELENAQR